MEVLTCIYLMALILQFALRVILKRRWRFGALLAMAPQREEMCKFRGSGIKLNHLVSLYL